MPQRTRKIIDRGIVSVNGVVYFERTKDGKLFRRKAPVQFSAALNTRGRPTEDLRRAFEEFADSIENESFRALKKARSYAPTVERLEEAYRAAAAAEYAKHAQPRPETVKNNVWHLRALAKDIGAERLDELTPEAVEAWVAARCAPGADGGGTDRARVSAWSSLCQARSLWARWTAPYYEREKVFLPECLARWPRGRRGGAAQKYERPPEELREATFEWYAGLEDKSPGLWLAATLMVQFAMRPADAAALRWSDFEPRADGNMTLRYVPSKTRVSAGRPRQVRWPCGKDLFARMRAAGGKAEHVLAGETHAQRYQLYEGDLNGLMRDIGWERRRWYKACYELRKLCIDEVYQRYGLERAVQISGDNPNTVRNFYSDPNCDTLAPVDLSKKADADK